MPRLVMVVLSAGYLAVILGLTLGGFYQPNAPTNFVPFASIAFDLRAGGRHLVVNLLGNLVAFLPVGPLVGSMARWRRPARAVGLASFGLSLFIEVFQGLSGRRVADVDDLILNTLGGLIGFGLWRVVRRRIGSRIPGASGGGAR